MWRLSPVASLVAALSFALGSYTITKVEFPSELASAAWFPWVAAAYLLWLRRRCLGRLVLLAVAFGIQFLAGFPEVVAFSAAALVLYGLWTAVADYRRSRKLSHLVTPMLGLVGAGILAISLVMAQFLPTLEALALSPRAGGIDPGLADESVHPLGLFTLLIPSLYGTQGSFGGAWGFYWAPSCMMYSIGTFYVGIVPVILLWAAGCRYVFGRRPDALSETSRPTTDRLPVGYLGVVTILFMAYAMGRYTPVFSICWHLLPFLRWFVSPPKCLFIVVLGLGCLAGGAFDWLVRTREGVGVRQGGPGGLLSRHGATLAALLLAVVIAVCLVDEARIGKRVLHDVFHLKSVGPEVVHQVRWDLLARDALKLPVIALLGSLLIGMYVRAGRPRARIASVLVAVCIADLWLSSYDALQPGPRWILREPSPHRPAFIGDAGPIRTLEFEHVIGPEDRVRLEASLPRAERLVTLGPILAQDRLLTDWQRLIRKTRALQYMSWPMADRTYRCRQSNVFGSRHVADLLLLLESGETPSAAKARLLAVLNCDRILLPPDLLGIFTGDASVASRLAMVGDPLARAFVVGGARVVRDQREVLEALLHDSTDLRDVAWLDAAHTGDDSFEDLRPGRVPHKVHLLEYVPNGLRIEVECAQPGLLVLTDAYYPGWVATVNDVPRPIYRVNYAMRGVRVSSGINTVELNYRPASWRVGVVVSLATLVLLLVGGLIGRTRRRWSGPRTAVSGAADT